MRSEVSFTRTAKYNPLAYFSRSMVHELRERRLVSLELHGARATGSATREEGTGRR